MSAPVVWMSEVKSGPSRQRVFVTQTSQIETGVGVGCSDYRGSTAYTITN